MDLRTITIALLTLTLLAGLEAKVHSQEQQQHHHVESPAQPYLGSYQVEDSCQFAVCGQDFSQEFGVGVRPSEGSCSGDCDQLAVSLVTNRFSREFLWSSCARMCHDKYSIALFSDYKSRLSCMSSCFSVYSSLAPHHNLARYCIQASCPADQSLPQLDCFSQCSSHVTSSVAAQDWEVWASQLTTTCQDDMGSGRYHRLECADEATWNNTISKVNHQEIDLISQHCRAQVCHGSLSCANICLEHFITVATDSERFEDWLSCSNSAQCAPTCSPPPGCSAERLACADTCLETRLAARRQVVTERSTSEHLAILASRASLTSLPGLITLLAVSFSWTRAV